MTLSVQIIQVPPTETVPKREFYLDEFPVTIGRDYAANVSLPDLSEKMSRSHLTISRLSTGRYEVSDVSRNGATLNGDTIPPKTATPLVDGDTLGLVGYKLLVGILDATSDDDDAPEESEPTLDLSTDLSSDAPLMPDAEVEEVLVEPEDVFTKSEVDLDPDLMFDPFAEGPEIDESASQEAVGESEAQPDVAFSEIVQLPDMPSHNATPPQLQDAMIQSLPYRENVNQAIERAIDRFIEELDPAVLQKDYDEYIPRFSRRKARYWAIHLRQFAKRKSRGAYRRAFMALFAEEIRKL